MQKAIQFPIIFHMPKFNGKVTLEDIHGRMGFIFHDCKDMQDCVLDTNFDMHIEDFYKDMIKGVHVMIEWYNGCDIYCTTHLIEDILDTNTMEEELYKAYQEAVQYMETEEEYRYQAPEL